MKTRTLFENQVTTAASIAVHPSRMMFSSPMSRLPKPGKVEKISYKTKGWKIIKVIKKDTPVKFKQYIKSKIDEEYSSKLRNNYDKTDVISKLKAADETSDNAEFAVGFAMEDEDGNIAKVYVQKDQAEAFEAVLSTMLQDNNTAREIADIIFDLRSRFNIIDAEWPTFEEDEELTSDEDSNEESNEPSSDTEEKPSEDDFNADEDIDNDDGSIEDDTSNAEDALDKVIDMMKADAEARKAEAEAREAEANATAAKYAHQATEQRIKDEEEMLEIEAAEKEAAEKEKEAKRIAKLAQHRYSKAKEMETGMSEQTTFKGMFLKEISNTDIARAEVSGVDRKEAIKQARLSPAEKVKRKKEELDNLSKSEDPLDRQIRKKREELARLLKMKQSRNKS